MSTTKIKKIIWKQNGQNPDKHIASLGNGVYLKAEKIDDKTFWWSVYIGKSTHDCFFSKSPRPKSIEEAKQQCEDKYREVAK